MASSSSAAETAPGTQGTAPVSSNVTPSPTPDLTSVPPIGTPSSTLDSTSASSNGTTTGHSNSKGVSNGAAAGIGIGCAVAGAVIAIIIFALFTRSRKGRRNISNGTYENTLQKESGDVDYKSANVISMTEIPLERADDSQIKKSMTDMNELIDQHVLNHYHNQPFQGQQIDLEMAVSNCGLDGAGDMSTGYMASVLINPRTRSAGIRRLIAYVILEHSQPGADESTSLLPGNIAGVSRTMLQGKRRPGEEQGKSVALFERQKLTYLTAFETSFAKWRQLSAFLLESQNNAVPTDNKLRSAVSQNVGLLNQALEPFINLGGDAHRHQADNLASIVQAGADTAMLLFSQPTKWVFGWSADKNAARNSLVVFPSVAEEVRNGTRSLKVILNATREEI